MATCYDRWQHLMIRSKVDFIKQKIVRMKEDLGMNELISCFCGTVSVVKIDVEKILGRSFSSDLESLKTNFYPSVVAPHGDTNISEIFFPCGRYYYYYYYYYYYLSFANFYRIHTSLYSGTSGIRKLTSQI